MKSHMKSLTLSTVAMLMFHPHLIAAPVVEGRLITYSDPGWFQVQRTADYISVCEGTSACEVEPGTYIVINHSTGQRSDGYELDAIDP